MVVCHWFEICGRQYPVSMYMVVVALRKLAVGGGVACVFWVSERYSHHLGLKKQRKIGESIKCDQGSG